LSAAAECPDGNSIVWREEDLWIQILFVPEEKVIGGLLDANANLQSSWGQL